MFAEAKALAAKGRRVFPVHWLKADGMCSCPKGAKCESPGKHPRISEWQKLASTEESWLKGWFMRQWPGANIGILTGEESGVCVVDIDLKSGGDVSLMELCDRHGIIWPETLTVLTGSGGFHYYFQFPKGLDLRNTSGKLGRGIDTRANGGFVVAPPSLHASGNRYKWVNNSEPAPLPDLLLKLLTEAKPSAAALSHDKARPQAKSGASIGAVIAFHERNSTLTKIAGALRGRGAQLPELEAELLDINTRRCSPPLAEDEVIKIARSVSRYPTEAEKRAAVRA
jgi:putative DNA primase/helicase